MPLIVPADQFDATIAEVARLTQQGIADEARRLHAEVMKADPRPLNFVRHVDGVEDAPEESVKPGGVIVYDYNRLDLIAKDALDLLRKESPVKSGDYVRSHTLCLNLKPVETLKDWQPGDEVSITNTVPYARVIETGQRGGTKIKLSVKAHIYERVAQALRRTYGNQAFIEFTYRAVIGGGQIDQSTRSAVKLKRGQKGKFAARGGVQGHNKSEARWPTIVIHPNSDRPGRLN
jgi:hypothetical protein